MIPKYDRFDNQLHQVRQDFLARGRTIDRQEWQAMRDDRPQTKTFECHNVIIQTQIPDFLTDWQDEVVPNLPWAEDHFQERVSGNPLNPGKEYKNWPWYEQGVEEHKPEGQFSHTYMERFWPRYAPIDSVAWEDMEPNFGIRYAYGDLDDVVDLLQKRPYTRQAYLPIWFPEDLSAATALSQRVPCTLGYHFQAMPSSNPEETSILDMFYPMRSCDYFRYLRDDTYLAGRLLQWVSEKVKMRPGKLTMHIANLHIFNDEVERLKEETRQEKNERLYDAFG